MKNIKYTTLFLDRDGVINEKIDGYVQTYSEFKFIDGVLESLKHLSEYFKKIIIVTNQQGIGKKIMTSDDLDRLHESMINEINLFGGRIDKIYYCPCLESENCACRKPNSGMLLEAKNDFPLISFNHSILIGDSETDMIAAKNVGVKPIKVTPEYSLSDWTRDFLLK